MSTTTASSAEFQNGGKPVAPPVYLVDANGLPLAPVSGGTNTTAVASGGATDTVIKAGPGRLCKVLITAVGTNALAIYDNASGHTGAIIGYVAASAAAGTLVVLDMPAANGITVAGNASNPGFTVSWS